MVVCVCVDVGVWGIIIAHKLAPIYVQSNVVNQRKLKWVTAAPKINITHTSRTLPNQRSVGHMQRTLILPTMCVGWHRSSPDKYIFHVVLRPTDNVQYHLVEPQPERTRKVHLQSNRGKHILRIFFQPFALIRIASNVMHCACTARNAKSFQCCRGVYGACCTQSDRVLKYTLRGCYRAR